MVGYEIGEYNIVEYIGKGSFGTVYKCENEGSFYAMKVFNWDFMFEQYKKYGEDNRITREIECLKIVNDDNVISFIDDGMYEFNNQKYIFVVMELVEGKTLSEYINENELSLEEIQDLFSQILDGLNAIHSKGIVHRDLKPDNIVITSSGRVKILDFGLSKLIDFTSITSTGDQMGSPLYMSPEQIRDSKNIDYRSDYYAAGIILYEMLSKNNPYGELESREQLYYKIINERPISILEYVPSIPNHIDNLINKLLTKLNYERPNSIADIKRSLISAKKIEENLIKEFTPNFFLRTWNEKTILMDYYKDGNKIDNIIFPINHQTQQKNLLKFIEEKEINYFFDPATMRLAYDTYADVKGIASLPYAPKGFDRLELDNLLSLEEKQDYVELVVQEQMKYNPKCIVAPFHVSNNSNLVSIKKDNTENWFTLDIKLLKETKEYMVNEGIDKPLVGGFCIKSEILTTKTEREYFLNVLSGLPCDLYWIYVDCINYNSNKAQIFNYVSSLLKLQRSTNKPVIAGRVGTIGLLLNAFGLYGFETGAARFESFYEDLYKDESQNYNMYVMYYMPELFKNLAISRKDPSKIISILKSKNGVDLKCNCPYCTDKGADEFLIEANTRKHFLYRQEQEIKMLRSLDISQRITYLESRIKNAIKYYQSLSTIFRESDYAFLKNWLSVIPELRKEIGV